jgi:hypothetical protein
MNSAVRITRNDITGITTTGMSAAEETMMIAAETGTVKKI